MRGFSQGGLMGGGGGWFRGLGLGSMGCNYVGVCCLGGGL